MIHIANSLDELSEQGQQDVISLGNAFANESNLGKFNYEHFRQRVEIPLSMGVARLFLMQRHGAFVGILGGIITPLFFTTAVVAVEMFWYVDEKFRGAIDSVRLLEAYEKWAEEQGVDYIYMGFMENVHSERLREFYEKRGYARLETGYMRKVK